MRRFNSRNTIGILVFSAMALTFLVPACRQEQEPLDKNRAPETYLTVAPPETTNAEYRVHLYWYGEDKDGVVTQFMWHRSDTLRTLRPDLEPELDLLDWNPEARKDDFETGTFTSATDTVIVFTGFDIRTGAMLNRQAFHIVAVDDGGRMDKTPARVQFFAKVNCIPKVSFWFESETIPLEAYVPGNLDTISMFEPFCVRFIGKTCNNIINGYQWIYRGTVYPDFNKDGVPDWYIPTYDPPETVQVCLENRGVTSIPEGDFYFRVTARDEAGARSKADIITGEGVFQVVINHDPDTKILFGENFYTDLSGVPHEILVDFDDAAPDTMPYNSRLRMHYLGWDDPKDSLQYTDPPVPMRFQFKFERWGYGLSGGINSHKPAWMPELKAEDTNCNSNEDSTTMRVGTYDYFFLAKSFDEQYRYDHTPDSVAFVGNFPPTIDRIAIAYDSIPYTPGLELADIKGDTVYIAIGQPLTPRPEVDYVSAYLVEYDAVHGVFNQFFKIYIHGSGHDDHRDPPGSGVKGWWFSLAAQQDIYYRSEKEWLYKFSTNTLLQEISFRLVIPRDPDSPDVPRPDPDFVNNLPLWMGDQTLVVRGSDLGSTALFNEAIRGVSPKYVNDDPCNELTSPGKWIAQDRGVANYARTARYDGWFYIKLVY
jgi:hypothetical protein